MAGFFPGGMNIFGRSNANNAGTPAAPGYETRQQQMEPKNPTPGTPNPQGQDGAPGTTGNNPDNTANNPRPPGSSLDQYADLFKMQVDDKGQPIQPPADPLAQPIINMDPAKLQEAASRMNFLAGVSPELLQKAQSGQDPNAFMEVLNAATRNAFTGATTALSKVVEESIRKNNERYDQALPDRVRSLQINQSQAKHPALNHPAAAPMVNALKHQIATANSHLSPDQVTQMAENYFISLSADISTHDKRTNPATSKQNAEPDWSSLLS